MRVTGSLKLIGLVVKNRGLRRLQLAWAGSIFGSCAYVVALSVIAFRAGGATAVGLLMLARTASAALASAPVSVLADRYPRRAVMAVSDGVRGVLLAAMALIVSAGGSDWWVYALAVVAAVVATAFRPAQAALLPALADTPEQLTAANAISGTIEGAGYFLGPGVCGLILALAGPSAVLWVCVAAVWWSAVNVWLLDEPARAGAAGEGEHDTPAVGFGAGFATLLRARALAAVTATYAVQALVAGALAVFTVVLAIDVLHLGNAGVGYLNSALGVGGVIGGVAAIGLAGTKRLGFAFALGVLAWGIGVALLGSITATVVILVILGGVGVGNSFVDVAAMTLLQRSAPDAVLGRVMGVIEAIMIGSIGLGSALAPAAIHLLGFRAAVLVTGLVLVCVVLVNLRLIVVLDQAEPATRAAVTLLRGNAIFAPLSEAVVEQLARRLTLVHAAAGDTLVRQGYPGDVVYLVASGELVVDIDGAKVGTVGTGDVFGEIALLRDVPRTATVTARADCDLYTLGRDDFLSAVTGHAQSAGAADLIVTARLNRVAPGALV